MSSMKDRAFVLVLIPMIFLGICGAASGKIIDLGVVGATYPVMEPDMLAEIQEKAAQIPVPKPEKLEEAAKSYQPDDLRKLPRASEERVHHPDFTYILDFDIPHVDQEGNIIGILYPKGYVFNPLDYMRIDEILVIIDGEDPEQVEWYKASEFAKDYRTRLLISRGNWFDVEQDVRQAVFYAEGFLIDKLNVKSVPAVVRQVGATMEVREVLICGEK